MGKLIVVLGPGYAGLPGKKQAIDGFSQHPRPARPCRVRTTPVNIALGCLADCPPIGPFVLALPNPSVASRLVSITSRCWDSRRVPTVCTATHSLYFSLSLSLSASRPTTEPPSHPVPSSTVGELACGRGYAIGLEAHQNRKSVLPVIVAVLPVLPHHAITHLPMSFHGFASSNRRAGPRHHAS